MVRRRFRWDRLAIVLVVVAMAALDLWILASYVDVILHNSMACPTYQHWNLFTTLF